MWGRNTIDKNKRNILYVSLDGRSIGIAFYIGPECYYSERRIHVTGETDRPIEELFKDIILAFKNKNTTKIDEIIILLESPWVREISTTIKEKRSKSFEIKPNTVSEIIKKDSITNVKDPDFGQDLGYSVECIKLNGYTYTDPIGKETEEIEISITKFLGDKDIIELVNGMIVEFWNKTKITYLSGANFIMQIAKEKNVKNDMYISLGATDTCIRIYSQGIVNKKIIIPFGFQNVLEKLDNVWKTESAETKHWIELFIAKSLKDDEQSRIDKDVREIISKLVNLMLNAEKNGALLSLDRPIKIYGGDKSWSEFFMFLLKNKYFGEVFPHIENIQVTELSKELPNIKGDALIALYASVILKQNG